jgi:hypothetical protein
LATYFLLRKKSQAKEIGQTPNVPNTSRKIEGIDKGTVAETTATLRAKGVTTPKRLLINLEDIRVPLKKPIIIEPANVIPNIYDRGVGSPLPEMSANAESFYNLAGSCSENIQNACKCSQGKKGKYRLDIPNLP